MLSHRKSKKIKLFTLGTGFGTFSVGPMLEKGLRGQKSTKADAAKMGFWGGQKRQKIDNFFCPAQIKVKAFDRKRNWVSSPTDHDFSPG